MKSNSYGWRNRGQVSLVESLSDFLWTQKKVISKGYWLKEGKTAKNSFKINMHFYGGDLFPNHSPSLSHVSLLTKKQKLHAVFLTQTASVSGHMLSWQWHVKIGN